MHVIAKNVLDEPDFCTLCMQTFLSCDGTFSSVHFIHASNTIFLKKCLDVGIKLQNYGNKIGMKKTQEDYPTFFAQLLH